MLFKINLLTKIEKNILIETIIIAANSLITIRT